MVGRKKESWPDDVGLERLDCRLAMNPGSDVETIRV
jgi:hypothetical protein